MKKRKARQRTAGSMEFAQAPSVPSKKKSVIRNIFLWTFEILVVILFAYVVVYFYGQSRTNIGQSMDITLSGGDTVLLDVLAYQLGSPKRGDVVSFKPNGSSTSHSNIKRIIGLPGETVQIKDGMIYINGEVYLENKSYPVITNPGMAADEIRLDEKEYFVLGDNRNNSEDSRFADIGLVRSEYIEGKVWFVLSPSEHRGFLRD
ncbi:MAG: signal peptidase I [Candidatus Choladocola sp.]|nr:signal peptidase I [Candidatus Choladocola sp.]